jgi:hypothetical protein
MVRHAVRVLFMAGLIGIGWAVGHAQATSPVQQPAPPSAAPPELSAGSDFELLVTSANGETEVRCVRGCRLTWAATVTPKSGPVEMLAPDLRVRGSVSQKGCMAPTWMPGNCHILGWKR